MRTFFYERTDDTVSALRAFRPNAQFLAGGTTLLDLMKLDVMRPDRIIDINGLKARFAGIKRDDERLWLGALTHMADAAIHPVLRRDFPVLAQSLELAASPQLRNMATLGGNVLQRTRCTYFRDPSWANCNKRNPGSGCAALEGVNRKHAVLGVSEQCIATYPGDFAQALVALGASVEIATVTGARTVAFESLHREPGDHPDVDSSLQPGELITGFSVPVGAWTKRSLYLKIRDRESYEFPLASAAVALEMSGHMIARARIGLGGVATRPWRAHEAEAMLTGKEATTENFQMASDAAFAGARSKQGNRYKIALGKRILVRALQQTVEMKV